MKLVSLFFAALMALTLTACSDNGSDNASGAQAPAASAPAAKTAAGYDPEADEDGDC